MSNKPIVSIINSIFDLKYKFKSNDNKFYIKLKKIIK